MINEHIANKHQQVQKTWNSCFRSKQSNKTLYHVKIGKNECIKIVNNRKVRYEEVSNSFITAFIIIILIFSKLKWFILLFRSLGFSWSFLYLGKILIKLYITDILPQSCLLLSVLLIKKIQQKDCWRL